MNAPVETHTGHRVRTQTEIVHDVMNVCRHMGTLAAQAEIAQQPPDLQTLETACSGLAHCLVELRAARRAAQ